MGVCTNVSRHLRVNQRAAAAGGGGCAAAAAVAAGQCCACYGAMRCVRQRVQDAVSTTLAQPQSPATSGNDEPRLTACVAWLGPAQLTNMCM